MKSLPKEHEKFHRPFEVFLYTFYNDFKVERFIARLDKLVHVNKLSTWTAILSKQREPEQEIQISAMDQG